MKHFVFVNPGEIDLRSITTFGVSSKETERPVGFFGTGLKYALAILLRHGCSVAIWSGEQELRFGLRRDRVRVDEFEFVTMNGEPMGFTTELGKTWSMWQALREVYCNCTDEGGVVKVIDEEPERAVRGHLGMTQVVVRGAAFEEAWAELDQVFVRTEPLWDSPALSIHPGVSQRLFYRGVRVYETPRPSLFTYNLHLALDLTEDRTLKFPFMSNYTIQNAILTCDNAEIIRRVVTAEQGSFEAGLEFLGAVPSQTFLEVVSQLIKDHATVLNKTARAACRLWFLENMHDAVSVKLNEVDTSRLQKAKDFCHRLGFEVSEYPIVVSDFLGEGVLGLASEGKIYLSRRCFMQGTKMVAGTLIEEYLHLRHGLVDESRAMQNFLLDALVSMGENTLGEPL